MDNLSSYFHPPYFCLLLHYTTSETPETCKQKRISDYHSAATATRLTSKPCHTVDGALV